MIELPYQRLNFDETWMGIKFEFCWSCARKDITEKLEAMQRPFGKFPRPKYYMVQPAGNNSVFGDMVNILATSGTL